MFYLSICNEKNVKKKIQITLLLTAIKNIDFDHVCHVIVYRSFLIGSRDCDV